MEPMIGLEPMTCRFQIGSLGNFQRGTAITQLSPTEITPVTASENGQQLLRPPRSS
jgi:hypothetical protein